MLGAPLGGAAAAGQWGVESATVRPIWALSVMVVFLACAPHRQGERLRLTASYMSNLLVAIRQ
jgi:hypothetical protein